VQAPLEHASGHQSLESAHSSGCGGADIWGTADAFNYVYARLVNDGQLVVRVDSLDNTNSFAKAGIMIRESLDPSAAHVMIDVTPSSLVEVLTRTSTGAETQWVGSLSPTSFPIWLKLTRTGAAFDAWASNDNVTWTHRAGLGPNAATVILDVRPGTSSSGGDVVMWFVPRGSHVWVAKRRRLSSIRLI